MGVWFSFECPCPQLKSDIIFVLFCFVYIRITQGLHEKFELLCKVTNSFGQRKLEVLY